MQVYSSVKVVNPKLERNDQVGVVVGAAEPVEVKFDDGDAHVVETFKPTDLQVL